MSNTVDTVTLERGNTKSRSRGWCFTVNNYDDTVHSTILKYCKEHTEKFIVGKEVGDSGTPHLQGYVYFKNAVSFNTLKTVMPTAHIEKAKGKPQQNFEYCSKDGNYITNMEEDSADKLMLEDLYTKVVWRPWQQQIIDIVDGPIDNRAIYWFWETVGNTGKSFLCKYLVLKYNAIIASGKQSDVFNQVLEWIKLYGRKPRLVIIDCPRSATEYIHYGCIEAIKNGLFFSGKYEGGRCVFYPPHVVVFSNQPPQETKMSADRWRIYDVGH